MSYDHWKTTDPRDSEPERLRCGCYGTCDPFAHDCAPDWDGRSSGPAWDDLSPAEQDAHRAEYEVEEAAEYRQLVSWLSNGNRRPE